MVKRIEWALVAIALVLAVAAYVKADDSPVHAVSFGIAAIVIAVLLSLVTTYTEKHQ